MTKLEFPPEPYMLFRQEKLSHICCMLLHWVLSSFVTLYERFIMLLKSRSHTHHPNMHYSYTGVGTKICLPFRTTQKHYTPTLGWTTKTCLIGFSIHQINAPKFCCKEEAWAMQKLFIKKEEEKKRVEKSWEKMNKCPRYLTQ